MPIQCLSMTDMTQEYFPDKRLLKWIVALRGTLYLLTNASLKVYSLSDIFPQQCRDIWPTDPPFVLFKCMGIRISG